MSTNTGIQWTDHTFNPWWGCIKVAQGCKNCYAEGVATRFYGRKVWGPNSERKIASEKVWNDPMRWNKQAEREGRRFKVFCASMGDVLEDHPALSEPRKRLIGVIESTPFLDWQLLTKRPENAETFGWGNKWPVNVWFGASAANQAEYLSATRLVAKVPSKVRFLSLEPLIGPIEIGMEGRNIDWIIVGGESGSGARPCDVDWVRSIVQRCQAGGVACFVKQLGAYVHWNGIQGGYLNGVPNVWPAGIKGEPDNGTFRVHLSDKKGGDTAEWPEDLRVREFPT